LAPKPHGGAHSLPSTRRSLLALGATGLLASGAAVALVETIGNPQASGAVSTIPDTGTPDWVDVTSYGADPTGDSDSTAAFTSALEALASPSPGTTASPTASPTATASPSPATTTGAGFGVIYIPAGTYKISRTLECTTVPVYFVGDGAWATTISFTGTGDCFRVYDSSDYGSRTKFGGGFAGITIDGTNAGATSPSTGLHVGDLLQYELDLTVQNFKQAGSIGVHLDNNYYWTEQLHGRIYASGCTSHVVFDWNTSTSSTSSGSFERCDLDIYIDQDHGTFDGVVFQNGAYVANGSLKIRGNFGYSTSPVTSAALRLTGSQSTAGYPAAGYSSASGITASLLDIGVECGTAKTGPSYTPQTIVFGSGANQISGCCGALNFGAAGNTFAESNNAKNITYFLGQATGDSTLPGGGDWATYSSGFPAGITGNVSFRSLPTGNEVMVSWSLAIAAGTTLRTGNAIVTVASKFAYNDNKVIPGNNNGADLSGNVYAPAYLTPGASFQYAGPSYEGSTPSYWYGQGVYSLLVG
jgi:hypothetical protein